MNRTRSTALALLTVLVAGATARAQTTGVVAGVRDGAGMFSAEAVKEADDVLKDVRRKTHWSALVETVESLDGKTVKDAALDNARALKVHGLYLLIAKKEHKFYAEPSRSAMKAFPHDAITKLDEAITGAFKAGKFDQGLLDAVALIRHDAEAAPDAAPTPPPKPANNTVTAGKTEAPAPAPKPADKPVAAAKPDVPAPMPKPGSEPAAPVVPDLPRPTPVPVAKTNEPAPNAEKAAPETGSMLPILLLGGGAVLLVLWLISRAFRGASPAPQAYTQPGPTVHYGPGVVPTPAPGPGYAPQAPVRPAYPPQPQQRPGYAPPPQPGYAPPPQPGYAVPPQSPYGYAPPPPQHGGGGFMSGVLGGAAGAVAGNILYDKFGRPHEGQGTPTHIPGGAVVPPHQEPGWPQGDTNPAPVVPPAETYDPNAGGGGDWGTPDPATLPAANVDAGAGGDWGTPEPAADADADTGAGGDWGTPEPVAEADADAGAGGDWGTPEPAPEPEAPADAGGDWGTPDEPADTGGGGDWGAADPGTDDNQGGSW